MVNNPTQKSVFSGRPRSMSLVGMRPLLRLPQPAVSSEFQQWGRNFLEDWVPEEGESHLSGKNWPGHLWSVGAGSSFLFHLGLGVVGLAGRGSLGLWP